MIIWNFSLQKTNNNSKNKINSFIPKNNRKNLKILNQRINNRNNIVLIKIRMSLPGSEIKILIGIKKSLVMILRGEDGLK